jgi:hypothetical protein
MRANTPSRRNAWRTPANTCSAINPTTNPCQMARKGTTKRAVPRWRMQPGRSCSAGQSVVTDTLPTLAPHQCKHVRQRRPGRRGSGPNSPAHRLSGRISNSAPTTARRVGRAAKAELLRMMSMALSPIHHGAHTRWSYSRELCFRPPRRWNHSIGGHVPYRRLTTSAAHLHFSRAQTSRTGSS